MLRNQDYTYEINEFNPVIPTLLIPGEYILSVSATIVGGVTEPYLGDNEMRVDMYLDYPYDGEIISINAPQTIYNTDSITGVVTDTTGKYYVNQSIYPNVIVRNNAIFTASAVPLHTIIINEATGDTV